MRLSLPKEVTDELVAAGTLVRRGKAVGNRRNSVETVSPFNCEVLHSVNSVALTSSRPIDHIALVARFLYDWQSRADLPECIFVARGPAGRAEVDLRTAVDQQDLARLIRQAFGRTRTA